MKSNPLASVDFYFLGSCLQPLKCCWLAYHVFTPTHACGFACVCVWVYMCRVFNEFGCMCEFQELPNCKEHQSTILCSAFGKMLECYGEIARIHFTPISNVTFSDIYYIIYTYVQPHHKILYKMLAFVQIQAHNTQNEIAQSQRTLQWNRYCVCIFRTKIYDRIVSASERAHEREWL